MKYTIFLMIIFACGSLSAGYFFPVEKQGATKGYKTLAACLEKESVDFCADISKMNMAYHEVKTIEVDDESKPIYKEKYNTVACADAGDCAEKTSKLAEDYCETGDSVMFTKMTTMPGWSYYCTKLLGYAKKTVKSYVENPTLKQQYESDQVLKSVKAAKVRAFNKAVAFGKSIKAEVYLINDSKNLSSEQVSSFVEEFQAIDRLLSAGAIKAARDRIALIQAGTSVSASEKQEILDKINAFLNQ